MRIETKTMPQIKARAVAREFEKNAFPLKIKGKYIRDEFGHLAMTLDGRTILDPIQEIENANVFVTVGKAWLGDVMIGVKATTLSYVAVGSGTTPPAAGDTDVETQIGARHIYTDRFRSSNIVTISTFFASGDNNGTWNNVGLFTAITAGDMFCHSSFSSPVTKSVSNTQTIDIDVTLT